MVNHELGMRQKPIGRVVGRSLYGERTVTMDDYFTQIEHRIKTINSYYIRSENGVKPVKTNKERRVMFNSLLERIAKMPESISSSVKFEQVKEEGVISYSVKFEKQEELVS